MSPVSGDPLEKELAPAPLFLLGKSRGQRSPAGYSPWGRRRVGHDWATVTHAHTPDRYKTINAHKMLESKHLNAAFRVCTCFYDLI